MNQLMPDDDRLARYLNERASAITVAPAEPAGIVARAVRRRRRRRTLTGVAIVAIVATAGGLLAAREPGGAPVATIGPAAPGVVDSTLQWTVVDPDVGLGYGDTPVQVAGGALYSLSTAPGPIDPATDPRELRSHLYRSDDGAEWREVALPDDLFASALATGGGQLYALGTAPAGGGLDPVLAATADGGESWSQLDLPLGLDALEARFPGRVSVSPSIASGPAGVVASVTVFVRASLDDIPAVADQIPGDVDPDDLVLRALPDRLEVTSVVSNCFLADGSPCEPGLTEATVPPDGEVADATVVVGGGVVASATWDELGVTAEERAYLLGRLLVFSSPDGSAFEEAVLPVEQGGTTSPTRVLASDEGFLLVFSDATDDAKDIRVLRSADGRTWVADPAGDARGYLSGAGLLDGRPALAISREDGTPVVRVAGPGGAWSEIDILAALGLAQSPAEDTWLGVANVDFGPLGLAAVIYDQANGGHATFSVAHSFDGVTFSLTPVAEHAGDGDYSVAGTTVTADAVTVRLNLSGDDDPETPPRQTLLVGTRPG